MNNQDVVFEKLITYQNENINHWLSNELFKWNWWVNVILMVVAVSVWWKLVDRKRINEIILFGCITAMVSSLLDILGTTLVWWVYPVRFLPIPIRLFPIDYLLNPIIFMLVYQYFSEWKKYIIAASVVCGILSFVGEPLFVLMGLYKLIKWNYIYSFVAYLFIAFSCRLIIGWFIANKIKSLA